MNQAVYSKTFCIAPWHNTHITSTGNFKGCCIMAGGSNNGYLQKGIRNSGDEKYIQVQDDGIHGGINSDTSKDIRKSMMEDKWHPECIRCQKEEKAGMYSKRLLYEARWKDRFTLEDAISITDEDGSLPDNHEPFFYDIQLGNLCNLKCRICYWGQSSTWIPDAAKLYNWPKKFNHKTLKDQIIIIEHIKGKQYELTPNPYSWAESDEFWEQMSEVKSKISNLYIIGGEPMMIHRHFDFLKECVESGDAKHISLQYDTNLTNLPKKVMKYWSEFEEIRIGFSIDGMGKELEYMRNPIKWKQMLKNIDILDEFSYTCNNSHIYDTVTVSIYNVLHVLDYIEWKIKAGKDSYKVLWKEHWAHFGVHPLHLPSHLCVQTIPNDAKMIINAKYNNWRTKMLAWVDDLDTYTEHQSKDSLKESINTYVDTWIGFINQNDNSKEMTEFWDYTNKLDEIRGESFSDVFPELNTLLKRTNIEVYYSSGNPNKKKQ